MAAGRWRIRLRRAVAERIGLAESASEEALSAHVIAGRRPSCCDSVVRAITRRGHSAPASGSSSSCLDENFRNFESLLAECRFESFYDPGIEIRAGCFGDNIAGLEGRNAFAIRSVAHECIVNVSHADDA